MSYAFGMFFKQLNNKASIGKDTSMYNKMISSFLKRSQGETEEELEEMEK